MVLFLAGMSSHPVSPSGPGSSWDHCLLNRAQLVQLVELFIGEDAEMYVCNYLVKHHPNTHLEYIYHVGLFTITIIHDHL